jgi:imidazolonepropionase-like amidohydrolase
MEAVPYNAAIMNKMGITVAINSDDAEMGRRLNQEAAKSIKYGGLTEEEALKLCTLNPAILLHLDKKMGSIKVGKDADVVLWNNNPLSIYAKVEKTFVDGIIYYDVERDEQNIKYIAQERERIIRKMIAAKKGGENTEKPKQKTHILYHCDD